jgi:hypothetical protein
MGYGSTSTGLGPQAIGLLPSLAELWAGGLCMLMAVIFFFFFFFFFFFLHWQLLIRGTTYL